MSSMVIDLATIANGLLRFGERFVPDMVLHTTLGPAAPQQKDFLVWYQANVREVMELKGLLAEASDDHKVLNKFLAANGREPMFEHPIDGVGIASLADLLVNWHSPGTITTIVRHRSFKAFDLDVYALHKVPGQEHPLVQVPTREGQFVWLLPVTHAPAGPGELFGLMQRSVRNHKTIGHDCKMRAPMVDLKAEADLNWLLGLQATGHYPTDTWRVADAKQTVRVRMNHIGASARVDTTMSMERMLAPGGLYVIDRPFVMCFTQERSQIPLAVAYVDFDSWREPPGLSF